MERLVCVLTHLWGRSICEVTHLHHKVGTGENTDSFQNFMRRFSQTFFFRKTFIDIFEGIWNLYFNIFKPQCFLLFSYLILYISFISVSQESSGWTMCRRSQTVQDLQHQGPFNKKAFGLYLKKYAHILCKHCRAMANVCSWRNVQGITISDFQGVIWNFTDSLTCVCTAAAVLPLFALHDKAIMCLCMQSNCYSVAIKTVSLREFKIR